MSAAATRDSAFRPEIEGLRALAALLVASYHIWFQRVSGGVDVFFVVSGFLITTSLLGQVARTGRVQFAKFWGSLVTRLMPAALFVLLVVIVGSVLWLPKARWIGTIEDVAASMAYVENWQLVLAPKDFRSPVEHFWALSVQGQFYLAWPLLVAAAAYATRLSGGGFHSVLLSAIGAIFVVSLAYSVFTTSQNQPFAYFNSLARAWEFCIGAMLAICLPAVRLPRAAKIAAGWIGVVAIISCGMVLQVSQVFPGYAALWPAVSAALVIAGGTTSSGVGVDRILASRPLVVLGGLAYGLYLWHFPILLFYQAATEQGPPGFTAGLAMIVAALVLAGLTKFLIEDPARYSRRTNQKPLNAFAFGAACLIPVMVALGVWSFYYLQLRNRDRVVVAANDPRYPGALALETNFRYLGEADVPVRPGPLAVRRDRPSGYDDQCHQGRYSPAVLSCTFGRATSARIIALVGGSHSVHWLPALQIIAEEDDWRITTFTKSGCPFEENSGEGEDAASRSCREWNESVTQELLHLKPDVVFTTSTRGSAKEEHVAEGSIKQWATLASVGTGVIAIRDNPWMGFNVPECVDLYGARAPRCSRPRSEVLASVDPTNRVAAPPMNLHFIDLSNYFCTSSTCFPVAGNVMIYRDDNHITTTYARTLAPILRREVARALGSGQVGSPTLNSRARRLG